MTVEASMHLASCAGKRPRSPGMTGEPRTPTGRIGVAPDGNEKSMGTNRLSNSPYPPDLRGFIAFLEAEHPQHVVRISKEVDPKFGVSGILERLERDGRFPLVIFEKVKGS